MHGNGLIFWGAADAATPAADAEEFLGEQCIGHAVGIRVSALHYTCRHSILMPRLRQADSDSLAQELVSVDFGMLASILSTIVKPCSCTSARHGICLLLRLLTRTLHP